MGIAIGTTITVTFDARQIAQLDCLLQNAQWMYEENNVHYANNQERINNIFKALHEAGYR
jgi:hypothetical protein